MRVALAQTNPTVADFEGNLRGMLASAKQAADQGAGLVVFSEMAMLGYPPRDLVEKPSILEASLAALGRLAAACPVPALVGFLGRNESGKGRPIHNSAALVRGGRVEAVRHKRLLPTYDVFDEGRYFEPGVGSEPIDFDGRRLGAMVCEDAWQPIEGHHAVDPVADLAAAGADMLINLSASPFTVGKRQVRIDLFGGHARRHGLPLLMCNQVGGNDELIFDGGSMVFNGQGELVAEAPVFETSVLVVDVDELGPAVEPARHADEEMIYRALTLGIRDYLHKCGFQRAGIGLSGGIDSTVTAVLAAEALGPSNVLGVSMPSRFSSQHSKDDARELANNLGIDYAVVPIEPAHQAMMDMLAPVFGDRAPDVTEENLQARVRGNILMAISNKLGALVLSTGNKSEVAVGYATLYGDMCGGLAPINDLPKTTVYALARWINRDRDVIPTSCIAKPPSAELRPDQTDQDTLPDYDVLDRILNAYIEERLDHEQICALGIDPQTVARTIRMIEASEYKRRQAVPGLKITSKAFGYGRRIPVAKKLPDA